MRESQVAALTEVVLGVGPNHLDDVLQSDAELAVLVVPRLCGGAELTERS